MTHRLSNRFNIILPPQLADQVAARQAAYGWKRSAIIQQALWEWLPKHPLPAAPVSIEAAGQKPALIAGRLYDENKPITYYLRPDMDGDQMLETLLAFEAAGRQQYTGD